MVQDEASHDDSRRGGAGEDDNDNEEDALPDWRQFAKFARSVMAASRFPCANADPRIAIGPSTSTLDFSTRAGSLQRSFLVEEKRTLNQ